MYLKTIIEFNLSQSYGMLKLHIHTVLDQPFTQS